MANTVKLKRSATPGAVPTTGQLDLGEVAINTYDGKMYIKQDNGTPTVIQVGAGGGGTDTTSLAYKEPVRGATTDNITLSGNVVMDGITTSAGDRILVKNQTTASENGIYIASASAWTRAPDFDANTDVRNGILVPVQFGTVNTGTLWQLTSGAASITLGSTSLGFTSVPGKKKVEWLTPGDYTWTPPAGVTHIDILVVAGGGAGGNSSTVNGWGGGGGGGGGVIHYSGIPITGQVPLYITVGSGGAAGSESLGNESAIRWTSASSSHFIARCGAGSGGKGNATALSANTITNSLPSFVQMAVGGGGGGGNTSGAGGTAAGTGGGSGTSLHGGGGATYLTTGVNGSLGGAGARQMLTGAFGGGGGGTPCPNTNRADALGYGGISYANTTAAAAPAVTAGGNGGDSYGRGGAGGATDTAGNSAAANSGAGGGGAGNNPTGSNKNGGAGGSGRVAIWYTL